MHSYSGDVTEPTCVQVLQPGYRFSDRVVRPARVAVAEPEVGPVPASAADDTVAGTESGTTLSVSEPELAAELRGEAPNVASSDE